MAASLIPGGTPPPHYQLYRYVPPQRVWFWSGFGLKTGIDFEHFGLKLGMVIGGTGEREREMDKIYHSS